MEKCNFTIGCDTSDEAAQINIFVDALVTDWSEDNCYSLSLTVSDPLQKRSIMDDSMVLENGKGRLELGYEHVEPYTENGRSLDVSVAVYSEPIKTALQDSRAVSKRIGSKQDKIFLFGWKNCQDIRYEETLRYTSKNGTAVAYLNAEVDIGTQKGYKLLEIFEDTATLVYVSEGQRISLPKSENSLDGTINFNEIFLPDGAYFKNSSRLFNVNCVVCCEESGIKLSLPFQLDSRRFS